MGEQVRVVVRVRPLDVVGSPSRKGRRNNARAEVEQPVVAVDTPDRVGYQVSPSERQVWGYRYIAGCAQLADDDDSGQAPHSIAAVTTGLPL